MTTCKTSLQVIFMDNKNTNKKLSESFNEEDQIHNNPEENLLSVFSILLDVAKRTNPKKYFVDYKKQQ